jgi:beta-ketoacyl-acyl-carrier-protein synthase II
MTPWLPDDQRVVVTGIGAVTPNGLDLASTWEAVRSGKSGIGPIRGFDASALEVRIAGEVRGFDPVAHLGRKEARRADRNAQLALVAAEQALCAADLAIGPHKAWDVGVYIASGAGGIATYVEQQRLMDRDGARALSPLLIPMIVVDSAAVQIAMRFGARGPNLGIASACSSSLDSLGLALEAIRRGDARAMLAGGTEAAVHPLGIAGFDRMRALSRRNDDPVGACRPFDRGRDGFVLSEGAVVLVLESLAHARERGAPALAELRAYAATADGLHLAAPDETGAGAARCMAQVLRKARLAPEEIDYICAHATGTPLGDPIEARAVGQALGSRAAQVHVSATKSCTGHLLGAAGALAVALTCCALRDGVLPPTLNLADPDAEIPLRHVANHARAVEARAALVTSYGFGGHNSALALTPGPH